MRRILSIIIALVFLCGCGNNSALDQGMTLRSKVGKGCAFDAQITADYGDKQYQFAMNCQFDAAGVLSFSVTDPSSISGIEGTVDETGGKLTFRDKALAFPSIADDLISPVAAPWLFVHGIRGGYLKSAENKPDGSHIIIDDTYRESVVQIDLYCDSKSIPVRGEILWNGRRILAIDVKNFVFQ